MKRGIAVPVVVALLLIAPVAAVGPVAALASVQATQFSGAHLSVGVEARALTDYAVEGTSVIDSLRVRERAAVDATRSDDGTLAAVVEFGGSDLTVRQRLPTRMTVESAGGAALEAHDNRHGVLVVEADHAAQYVGAALPAGASATLENGSVAVAGDGWAGVFLVVGDGRVVVNDGGGVTARLSRGDLLVYRAYPDGARTDTDRADERLVVEGTTVAEVYLSERDEAFAADTVTYAPRLTVDVTRESQGDVVMTVGRPATDGGIVVVAASERVFPDPGTLSVTVDGGSTAEVDTHDALAAAVGGDGPAYLVRGSEADGAGADVLVAVNRFPAAEREVTIRSGGAGVPGVGVVVGVLALLAGAALVALSARRRAR